MPFSAYALIMANLIPLVGVIFFGWDTVLVLALFWIENLIIGAFNLLRIITVAIVNKDHSGWFTSVFFVFHYGAFCSVHGILLSSLLGVPEFNYEEIIGFEVTGVLQLFAEGLAVLLNFIEALSPYIWFGLIGLAASHLVSFVEHFILRGEVFNMKPRQLMSRPYHHVVVMHVGLILGAIVLQKLQSPVWLLAIIVSAKLVVDYQQHRLRHLAKTDSEQQIKDI